MSKYDRLSAPALVPIKIYLLKVVEVVVGDHHSSVLEDGELVESCFELPNPILHLQTIVEDSATTQLLHW